MQLSRPSRSVVKTQKKAIRTAIETLERRAMMDANYHSLSGGSFLQDWSDAGLITANDDWGGVPSITGYRGDALTNVDNANPQTLLAPAILGGDTPAGVVDVNANLAAVSNSTGGVGEFAITNNTIALQGSNTADAPFIVLQINSTGVPNVNIAYKVRDIDSTADNTAQQVALQYRTSTAVDAPFIDVPGGYIADATTGPSAATLVTPINLTLPAGAGNQPNLQIRIITANAPGNDEWVGIDDIVVSNADGAPGSFVFSTGEYPVDENLGPKTITVNRIGGNLGAATVRVTSTNGGTATAGADYGVVDQILNFANNQNSATFDVTINNDTIAEPSETISLLLSEATVAGIGGQSTATITINDNDSVAPTGFVLNELSANPPGSTGDGPYEYIEFKGAANQPLFNTYFVSLEGDAGSVPGTITFIQELSAATPGSNGLLVLKADGGFSSPAATNVILNSALAPIGGALQNGSNSFLVVFSPSPLTLNQDLDLGDDGTLDLPAGASVVDGIGWLDGSSASDRAYGSAILSPIAGTLPPDAASRFRDSTLPNAATEWYFGDLEGNIDSVTYTVATISTTNPGGIPTAPVVLTPGDANLPPATTGGDTTPPTVLASAFVYNAYPTLQTVTLSFDENVSATLAVGDITLTNLTTNTTIPSASISLSYNGNNNVASFTFPGVSANGSLADGNYRLTLAAGSVQDAAGNALVSASVTNFFAYSGDANHDRTVNISDFSALAANFNASPRTFSQGDFDYNGLVNISDFSILAAKFNQSLAAPASLPRVAGGTVGGVFSSTRIENTIDPVSKDLLA